jgi:hypothetical protein
MAHNNRGDGWNHSQRDAPFNDNYGPQQYNRRQDNNNQSFPTPKHEMAWRQQANNRSVNYMHNGPQQPHNNNSQFSQTSQLNSYNRNTNNFNNNSSYRQPVTAPPPPKRANKRRFRHEVPGPAGAWFQQQKQKNKRIKNKKEDESTNNKDSNNPLAYSPNTPHTKQEKNTTNNIQLFKDYSSNLHDCNAWNLMCTIHNRIVPSFHTYSNHFNNDYTASKEAATSYTNLLRNILPQTIGLIHEINNGQYDIHHLSPSIHTNDLRIPLLFGYVSSISCHAHSDWTALLVDESYSCGNRYSCNRGITCWLEERLVKRHPGWIRPGVVWMLEGSKLALFASKDECQEQEDVGVVVDGETNDVSPSTQAARSGRGIDRMICVGESSLVYAWTPEEASEFFTNEQFKTLLERRCNVDLERGAELLVGEDVEEVDDEVDCNKFVEVYSQLDCSGDNGAQSALISEKPMQSSDGAEKDISPVVSRAEPAVAELSHFPELGESNQENRTSNTYVSSTTAVTRTETAPIQNQERFSTQQPTPIKDNASLNKSSARESIDVSTDTAPTQNAAAPTISTSHQDTEQSSVNKAETQKSNTPVAHSSGSTARPNPYLNLSPKAAHSESTSKNIRICITNSSSSNKESADSKSSHCNPYQKANETITPKKAGPKQSQSTQIQCPPSAESFDDSLAVDEDQLFCTSSNAQTKRQNETCQSHVQLAIQHQTSSAAPTSHPFEAAKDSSHETAEKRAETTTDVTPKRQASDKSSSFATQRCPPTGESFDDSLDIDDDELFHTSVTTKHIAISHPPEALNITGQNNISPLGIARSDNIHKMGCPTIYQFKTTADTKTSTKPIGLPPGSFAFDNIDDDDLASLDEEDI